MTQCIPSSLHLEKELAQLVRVRNRLASTEDNNLPQVLRNLLPRLLRRLDENTMRLYVAESEERRWREQMQAQLTGTLCHVLERTRGGNSEMDTATWIQTVLPDLNTFQSTVTLTLVLSLLQVGLPRCSRAEASRAIAPLMMFVDAIYKKVRVESTQTNRSHFRTAGWLLLDAIALASGLQARVDWDMEDFKDSTSNRWDMLEKEVAKADSAAREAVLRDGAGVLDLLLDILLFWPPSHHHPHHGIDDADNATGLSIEGLARINHRCRGASWNELHLRQLKYACVCYSIWPMNQCLFQAPISDRALLLAVITASGGSMHGRVGNNLLNQWEATRISCSLSLACCVLILVVGDQAASVVLDHYPQERALCDTILGPRSSESSLCRSPLPIPVAARVVGFLRDHFRPDSSIIAAGNGGIRLFVHLVNAVQDPARHGAYWGIQLLQCIYQELRDSVTCSGGWVAEFRQRCLATAKSVLAAVPDESLNEGDPPRGEDQDNPLGVPEPFGRRSDLNKLLSNHRSAQKKRRLRLEDALTSRQWAYQMIVELSPTPSLDEKSWELPILLFRCAVSEDETMQPYVARALKALLLQWTKVLDVDQRKSADLALCHLVAPLLPSILSAACADSATARLSAVQWSSELLTDMDPPAALHICRYLAEDPDSMVSMVAKKVIPKLKMITATEKQKRPILSTFLDVENNRDIVVLKTYLEESVAAVSKEAGISKSVTSLVLHDFQFSRKEATDALRADLSTTMDSCGFLQRKSEAIKMIAFDSTSLCGICYEDKVEMCCLGCYHAFCHSCWRSYLFTAREEGAAAFLKVTCPHHKCTERLSDDDIRLLCPDLLPSWEQSFLLSFVERSELYRPCPGPDCQMVAHLPKQSMETVCCPKCHTTFCFQCGNPPHQPAACRAFDEWNRIFGTSTFWVKKNAKPCPNPSCRVPIEKNQGCNHIQCTQCGTDFCWLCLAPLQSHLEAHTCNRYDPASAAEDDEERRSLFYTERYQVHDDLERFAEAQINSLNEKLQTLELKFRFITDDEFETLYEAVKKLVDARNFLKYSYVEAWALRNDLAVLQVFESHQATLELATERLSRMTQENLGQLYTTRGERGIRLHFRAMAFHIASISDYMQRVLSLRQDI